MATNRSPLRMRLVKDTPDWHSQTQSQSIQYLRAVPCPTALLNSEFEVKQQANY